ncbi:MULTISPECIES: hypothetical protein [Rahnella]|jgi:hypothetical protein|uniref:Prophage protein n=1 Tax=Rahnella sp. (strain Y9602) TaxID=2703885 RepID=A0A0H3FKA7_RAHSY|nr:MULTISPECIES: hypothetical protein [Rahnella]AFE60140.1 hypothetical protein Q7S_19655 [Rahnella aquatilis HX2]AYA08743.1 hypothetical protein D3Z09_20240 [Rahnella aquatilis]ADW75450.1 hypothetical protein Rahaq_3861 [Rahnella aceris]AZP43891.1 hypothetical protein EJP79_19355 [Rahnella aquatilis]AZP48228.1 hypothetical protein EJP81_19355 [Rahnella aquatilis]
MPNLYDNTPLELEEIVDHCRALSYAIVSLDNPQAKDLLSYILCERLEVLYQTLEMPISEDDVVSIDVAEALAH